MPTDETLLIRPISPSDDAAVAAVIRRVMPEFGACGAGFAINDPEVDYMARAYDRPGAAYFVVEDRPTGVVVGGGGVAPLEQAGADVDVCELRKMYFLPEARGRGAGARMLQTCLDRARALGYRRCYLETLTGMEAAQRLYEKCGFARIPGALGATGHFGCDRYYLLAL
jgi:putative acetyltransferase